MAKQPDGPKNLTRLRRQAEKSIRITSYDVTALSTREVQRVVHELQVFQVELEMQNEELRRTQSKLQVARDRYVNLYDFSPAGHLTLDLDNRIVEANLRAGWLLGCYRKELIGQPLACFVTPDDQALFRQHWQEVLKTGTRQTCEVRLRNKAADAGWLYLESLVIYAKPGCSTHWRTSLMDISNRKRAEQDLEVQRAQLEVLAEQFLVSQEQERQRIARDLHDDFNQRLAALMVEMVMIERCSIGHLPERILRQFAGIRAGIGQLSDDLANLAHNLHSSLLDHVGLEAAVRAHTVEFTQRTGLSVTFISCEVPQALAPEVKTNLFRIMQESLQNVFKHAQASAVTVRLCGSSKGISLSVCDNGKGFDCERNGFWVKGLGLTSMQERVRSLGGFFSIRSLPAEETKLCVWIPCSSY